MQQNDRTFALGDAAYMLWPYKLIVGHIQQAGWCGWTGLHFLPLQKQRDDLLGQGTGLYLSLWCRIPVYAVYHAVRR